MLDKHPTLLLPTIYIIFIQSLSMFLYLILFTVHLCEYVCMRWLLWSVTMMKYVNTRLVFVPCNLRPPNITSNFTLGTAPDLGHTSKMPDRPTQHAVARTHTHFVTSPFVIITSSFCISNPGQPILLGVTDHFKMWKAAIGYGQCGRKRITDRHGRVSGIRQRHYVCFCMATVSGNNLLTVQTMELNTVKTEQGEVNKGVEGRRQGK